MSWVMSRSMRNLVSSCGWPTAPTKMSRPNAKMYVGDFTPSIDSSSALVAEIVSSIGTQPPATWTAKKNSPTDMTTMSTPWTRSVHTAASMPPAMVYAATTSEPIHALVATEVPNSSEMITPIEVTCAVM